MLVFVTGAAGFIGQAVVKELLDHGHQVLGLARSDSSAETITQAGGQVHRGDLGDVESLKSGAKAADGTIHLAFIHDFSEEGFVKALQTDRDAIEGMADAMEGTGKPLVIASGALIVAGLGKRATEDTKAPPPTNLFSQRGRAEILVEELSVSKNIRGSTVRLPPTVHGAGDKGFIAMLAGMAKKNGFVTYVDDGNTSWPAAHRYDCAALFRLALEKGKAGGMYHAVAEENSTRSIMEAIGRKASLPVKSQPFNDAMQAVGFFAMPLAHDCQISSEKTQTELGWKPTQPRLFADIEANYDL